MKTSKTFNVYFWLKNTARKKNGNLPIYARIAIDGKSAKNGHSIPPAAD